jgi:hypothetical protein
MLLFCLGKALQVVWDGNDLVFVAQGHSHYALAEPGNPWLYGSEDTAQDNCSWLFPVHMSQWLRQASQAPQTPSSLECQL